MTEGAITEQDLIDGYAQDVPGTAVAVVPALAVTPAVPASELVARLDVIKEAMAKAMVEGVDYGRIPGVAKPSLWKPGAEKLAVLFQLDVQTRIEKIWGPGDHLTAISESTVFHAPTSTRLGGGEGLCTTREVKYAKRKQERTCPSCGLPAVIKGKAEYGGGWLCFKKKGGCGAKWSDGAQEIESQPVGEIENPDLPDFWNTVIKMAKKRALVDAVLLTTGASAIFTQDVEDMPAGAQSEVASADPPSPRLTAAQRDRVLGAIADTQQNELLIFAAVGISSAEELTAAHANQIHELLTAAVPS